MQKNLIIVLLAVLVSSGIGFFLGTKYQESKTLRFQAGTMFNRSGQTGGMGNRFGFRPISGEIISTDSSSLTVKLTDGSSKMIILTDKTEISEATKVDKTTLKDGLKVAVLGTENSDGSVTAQTIQLNPQLRLPDSTPPVAR